MLGLERDDPPKKRDFEEVRLGTALLSLMILLGVFWFLAGCSNGSNGSGYNIPTPGVGQWADFGGAEPAATGNPPVINLPCCNGSEIVGYYYTKLPAAPTAGQTLTLNYSFDVVNPVYVQAPASGGNTVTDTNPPTIHLFLWENGDNLSCAATQSINGKPYNGGYADYRLFGGRTNLVPGDNQTLSVPIDSAHFTGCWGAPPLDIQTQLSNLLGAGVTFGGQSFAGHGVYLSSGSAKFTINSFSVN